MATFIQSSLVNYRKKLLECFYIVYFATQLLIHLAIYKPKRKTGLAMHCFAIKPYWFLCYLSYRLTGYSIRLTVVSYKINNPLVALKHFILWRKFIYIFWHLLKHWYLRLNVNWRQLRPREKIVQNALFKMTIRQPVPTCLFTIYLIMYESY